MAFNANSFLLDVLPYGPIWSSAKTLAFITALGELFQIDVEFLEALPAAVDPRTCGLAILQQWAEYYKVPPSCFPPIADENELRARVLARILNPYIGTPDGLQMAVDTWFEFVTIRDALTVPYISPMFFAGFSLLPIATLEQYHRQSISQPFKIVNNSEVAVLEVYWSPRLDNIDVVKCFFEEFDQARNRPRFVHPSIRVEGLFSALSTTEPIGYQGVLPPARMNIIQSAVQIGTTSLYDFGVVRADELVSGGIPAGTMTVQIERQKPDTTWVVVLEQDVLVS
jgi:hypothetical protein